MAFINPGMAGFRVLLGKGDGTLASLLNFDTGSGPGYFVVADLNGDGRPDVVLSNLNDATITVALNTFPTTGADLAVNAAASSSLLSVTQSLNYTVSVQNYGPQDATNVVLTDTLPSTVNFVSVTSNEGTCTEANLVVVCNVSKLVSGDSVVATIGVVPTSPGAITNTADAIATETDTSTANNKASTSTQVDSLWTLTVTISGAGTGTVAISSAGGSPLPYPGGVFICNSSCTLPSLPVGTALQLLATPDANMGFGGWSGACTGGGLAPVCDAPAMSSNQTVTVEFDTLPNFAFWLTFFSVTVQQGKTDTETVNLYPEGTSFADPIVLTCAVQGSGTPAPTCSLSPASVTLPDSNGTSSTLTITTTGSSLARGSFSQPPFLYAFFVPFLAILVIVGSSSTLVRSRTATAAVFVSAVVLMGALMLASCGGGSNSGASSGSGGTPRGTYTMTITATSGILQHSTSMSLTVQ